MNNTVAVGAISVMTQLRASTQASHASIEKCVDAYLQIQTIAAYRELLIRFWGFFEPMENGLRATPLLDTVLPDLHQRMRIGLLRGDLLALGLSPRQISDLPRCTRTPLIDSAAQALGSLYVMEGSTLGGQILLRQIKSVDESLPCGFFGSYGENVGAMWRRYKACTEVYAAKHPSAIATICSSAKQTFDTFEAFLGEANDGGLHV